jgi:hypothetical protein
LLTPNQHPTPFVIIITPQKVLPFEQQYLDALPCAAMYEKSYMHRDTVTRVVVRLCLFALFSGSGAAGQRR